MRDGILGEVAQKEGGRGDAELRRREEAIQLPERFSPDARFAIAPPDHGLDPRAAGCYEREFSRNEESVGRHKRDDGQQPQTEDVHGPNSIRFVARIHPCSPLKPTVPTPRLSTSRLDGA